MVSLEKMVIMATDKLKKTGEQTSGDVLYDNLGGEVCTVDFLNFRNELNKVYNIKSKIVDALGKGIHTTYQIQNFRQLEIKEQDEVIGELLDLYALSKNKKNASTHIELIKLVEGKYKLNISGKAVANIRTRANKYEDINPDIKTILASLYSKPEGPVSKSLHYNKSKRIDKRVDKETLANLAEKFETGYEAFQIKGKHSRRKRVNIVKQFIPLIDSGSINQTEVYDYLTDAGVLSRTVKGIKRKVAFGTFSKDIASTRKKKN